MRHPYKDLRKWGASVISVPSIAGSRTLAEAAKYLQSALKKDVTEADVIRLGIDHSLRLSAYFVNGALARCGKFSFSLSKKIYGDECYEPPAISYLFQASCFEQDIRDVVECGFPDIPYNERVRIFV